MTDGRDPAAIEYASILSPRARHTLIDAGEGLLAWYAAETRREGPGLGFVRLAPGGAAIAVRRFRSFAALGRHLPPPDATPDGFRGHLAGCAATLADVPMVLSVTEPGVGTQVFGCGRHAGVLVPAPVYAGITPAFVAGRVREALARDRPDPADRFLAHVIREPICGEPLSVAFPPRGTIVTLAALDPARAADYARARAAIDGCDYARELPLLACRVDTETGRYDHTVLTLPRAPGADDAVRLAPLFAG